jgi:PAS domain S-box-containing protein
MTTPPPPTEQAPIRGTEDWSRFFSLSPDLLCIAGYDGYFKHLNPSWTRTLGWGADELLARPYLEFVHPDDRAATLAQAQRLGRGDATISFENRYRCRDGAYRWLEWTAAPADREGLIYAVARDRTGHKAAEAEIERTHLFLESIVENIPSMIFVKDAGNLRFLQFNRAGEALLGYARAELIGKNDYDFFPKDEADAFVEKDREVLRGGKLVDIPAEPVRTKDRGVRLLHTRKLPLPGPDGEPMYLLGISEDVTEHQRLDSAKSEFIALASHQLRTPLTAVCWSLELLQDEDRPGTPEDRQLLRDAYAGARRMADTIQTMLRVSCIEADSVRLRQSVMSLRDLLQDVQSQYASACAAKGLDFSLACPEVTLLSDPQVLSEILGSIVSNAVKYTPPGGTIRAQIDPQSGHGVSITVSDTGIGIPRTEQPRVFTKLFRGANAIALDPAGTGLGLYVAASLAHLLGAALSFISQEGQGAAYTLTLPPSPSAACNPPS